MKTLILAILICMSSVLSAMEKTEIGKEASDLTRSDRCLIGDKKHQYQIAIKVLEDISDDFTVGDQTRRRANGLITHLRTKIQNEHDDKNETTSLKEKLSILGGDIDLLEMKLLKHEAIMKRHGWKVE